MAAVLRPRLARVSERVWFMNNISFPLGGPRVQGPTQTTSADARSDGPGKGPVLFTRQPRKTEIFPSTHAAPTTMATTLQHALQQAAPPRPHIPPPEISRTEIKKPPHAAPGGVKDGKQGVPDRPRHGKLQGLLKLIKLKPQGPPVVATKPPQQWKAWEGITPEQHEAMETFVESPLYKKVEEAQTRTDVGMLVSTSLTAYAGKVLRDGAWVKSPTNKLTLAEATAIRLYGQQAYPEVNPWFWLTKEGQRKTPPAYMEAMRDTIEAGLSALPDNLEYDKNTGTFTVYRGTDFWPPNLKIGDTYGHWGFQSTSSDPGVVKDRFDMKYRMEIVLPKGTGAKRVEDLTANKREKEVLIPTGVCFRVEKYAPEIIEVQKADGTVAFENVVNVKLVAVVPDVVDSKPFPVGPDPAARRRAFGFTGIAPGKGKAEASS